MEIVNPLATPELQSSQRIAAALREASERLESFRRQTSEPLAVIGMACRFPGADSPDEFWQSLLNAECAIGDVPEDRWDKDRFHADQPKQPGRVTFNGGGFLSEIDRFDSKFFEITHREARSMDPQQRLMLEIAWETLENAGVLPEQWFGKSGGVFAGMCSSDYLLRLRSTGLEAIDPYFSTGNAHGAAAGRLSYWLKWQGPSLAIDTACSSSLVAVHLAMQSLRNQECDVALAMGVNVILAPDLSISLSQAGMLSPSGVSRTFASGADGFVRGEGCGAVLLKRLSDAQRDGDRIFCVLKGSAVNQDGRSNGLTAPNGPAQRDVIRQSLRRASLQPDDIDYIEAHGTGTELGDPIEVGAIAEVFAPRKSPLLLGSVKTNIGHLEGAAGIAGLIKTCLSLHHQTLPQHLHFDQPSPHIDWQPMIEVAAQSTAWPRRADHVRRAGVSSFGFGGTNAHVIVEEAPPTESNNPATLPNSKLYWFKVSAKTPTALCELASRYADAIQTGPLRGADLYELSVSANIGRSDWAHRAVVCYSTTDELIAGLREISNRDAESIEPSIVGNLKISNMEDSSDNDTMPRLMTSYLQGESIDWPSAMGTHRRTLSLPTYPFERQRCWYRSGDESSASDIKPQTARGQSLLGTRLDLANDLIVFETDISGFAELADHRVGQSSVFPAAGYLELAGAAAKSLSTDSAKRLVVSDVRLLRPLTWSLDQPMRVQVVVDPATAEEQNARILSRQTSGWQLHATCKFTSKPSHDSQSSAMQPAMQPALLESKTVSPIEHYDRCDHVGLRYSGAFRCLKSLNVTPSSVDGEVALPMDTDISAYELHPALLDGCFQGIAGMMSDPNELWLPVSVANYEMLSAPADSARSLRFHITQSQPSTATTRTFDLNITTIDHSPVARISQLVVKKVSGTDHTTPADIRTFQTPVTVSFSDSFAAGIANDLIENCCTDHSCNGTILNGAKSHCGCGVEDPLLVRLRQRLSAIIECDESEIDVDTPLENLGFDSMMAIEMLDTLEKDFGVKIPTDQFWSGLTLGGLLQRVQDQASHSTETSEDAVQWVEGTL